jgi:transposase-like protein
MSAAPETPRIPLPAGEIQVNFCKNPTCANFAQPASTAPQPRGRWVPPERKDRYAISGTSDGPQLRCLACNEFIPVKSNAGIAEEIGRISRCLQPPSAPSCPGEDCENNAISVEEEPDRYWAFGKTKAGTPRFRCKACRRTFSGIGAATRRQRKSHVNSELFRALMLKMPIRCAAEFARISAPTVYDKIDFIHRQCLAFAAVRERRLMAMSYPRAYVCVDRMDHVINWTNRADKRNVVLQAVGSADLKSGYVYGIHANYDHTVSSGGVALDAVAVGDHLLQPPHRKYARFWLPAEYEKAMALCKGSPPDPEQMTSLEEWIEAVYKEAISRGDIERPDSPREERRLPKRGLLVHAEYTLYAHFFYLKRLLAGAEKVRFFMDQESGIRAACLCAFWEQILAKDCDAFYVSIRKNIVKEKKLALVKAAKKELKEFAERNGYDILHEREQRRLYIKERMRRLKEHGKWRDRWLDYPFPNMSEPEKRICYLTNLGAHQFDYDEDHMANLYLMATLHPIDRFFMQLRRKNSMLERPIESSSNFGRKWYGYSPYDPANAVKIMEIYRVYYNYVKVGDDRKTPAMRLGLAKGPCSVEDIIYFTP